MIKRTHITTHFIYESTTSCIENIIELYKSFEVGGILLIFADEFQGIFYSNPRLKMMLEKDFLEHHDEMEYIYTIAYISYNNSELSPAAIDKITRISHFYGFPDTNRCTGRTTKLIEKVSKRKCIYFCREQSHADYYKRKYIDSKIEFKSISQLDSIRCTNTEIYIDHAVMLSEKQYTMYLEYRYKWKLFKKNFVAFENSDEYYKIENCNFIFYVFNEHMKCLSKNVRGSISHDLTQLADVVYCKTENKIIKSNIDLLTMIDKFYGIVK